MVEKNHTEFLQEVVDGFKEDWQIQDYLRDNVLNADHRKFLTENELSVVDILNGRYPYDEEMSMVGWMVSVNQSISGELFKW